MTIFQVGDRVRIKVRPHIEGTVDDGPDFDCGSVRFQTDRRDFVHRYPEELELVPRPASWYVGKTVRIARRLDLMKVLGTFDLHGEDVLILDHAIGYGTPNSVIEWTSLYRVEEVVE